MTVLFISDLHLSEKNLYIVKKFFRFLRKKNKEIKSIYILGDFFDYWIGFDHRKWFYKKIEFEFKKLQKLGILCYFIQGNRDFLINEKFAKKIGLIFLSNEKVLKIYNKNILVLHGDILCSDDFWYQFYRKLVYKKFFQILFFFLPLIIRKKIAKLIRKRSKLSNKKKSKFFLNVNKKSVIKKFKQYKVHLMIHGHVHFPLISKINLNGKKYCRIVLSDWNKIGTFVKINKKKIRLIRFYF